MALKNVLFKLFLGKREYNVKYNKSALKSHAQNLVNVWNNENNSDIGLEKILRLFLLSVQFVFPGLYIRQLFGRRGLSVKNLAIEVYVLLKTAFPLILLLTGGYTHPVFIFLVFYILTETIFYNTILIFASDVYSHPRSYRRSVLLLFFNYIEIVFDFAVIYGGLHLLGGRVNGIIDFIYFSFVTSATISFADIYPITNLGKIMVGTQSVVFFVFIVLFFNFFSSRVKQT